MSVIHIRDDKAYVEPRQMREAWAAFLHREGLAMNRAARIEQGEIQVDVSFLTGTTRCTLKQALQRRDLPSLALLWSDTGDGKYYFLVVLNGGHPHVAPFAAEVLDTTAKGIDDLAFKELRKFWERNGN